MYRSGQQGKPANAEDEMRKLVETMRIVRANRRGVTALEYGLIAAVVAAVMVVGATSLGTSLSGQFSALAGVV
jgi:pilus assembly protein Flp/PilA